MSTPRSAIAAIASGLTKVASVPALMTSNRSPASCRKSPPSAIWERAELWVHRNSTLRRVSTSCSGIFALPRLDTKMVPSLDEEPAGGLAIERVDAPFAAPLLAHQPRRLQLAEVGRRPWTGPSRSGPRIRRRRCPCPPLPPGLRGPADRSSSYPRLASRAFAPGWGPRGLGPQRRYARAALLRHRSAWRRSLTGLRSCAAATSASYVCVTSTETSSKPTPRSSASYPPLHRPGDAPGPQLDAAHHLGRELALVPEEDHAGDREPSTGLEHPESLAYNPLLCGGEVDDAVAYDDVHVIVGERDILYLTLEELHVLDPGLPLVLAGQLQHLVCHV